MRPDLVADESGCERWVELAKQLKMSVVSIKLAAVGLLCCWPPRPCLLMWRLRQQPLDVSLTCKAPEKVRSQPPPSSCPLAVCGDDAGPRGVALSSKLSCRDTELSRKSAIPDQNANERGTNGLVRKGIVASSEGEREREMWPMSRLMESGWWKEGKRRLDGFAQLNEIAQPLFLSLSSKC